MAYLKGGAFDIEQKYEVLSQSNQFGIGTISPLTSIKVCRLHPNEVTMKIIRWKGRYLTGETGVDQRNRALVDCLNGFINATKQREHCQDVENLLNDLAVKLEGILTKDPMVADLIAQIRDSLMESLPLPTRKTPACRKCDICDLAEQRIAQHIHASVQCLGMSESVGA
ncbi:hypothetical protein CCP3SC1_2340001 [Gammaproteobacteria bacterium]